MEFLNNSVEADLDVLTGGGEEFDIPRPDTPSKSEVIRKEEATVATAADSSINEADVVQRYRDNYDVLGMNDLPYLAEMNKESYLEPEHEIVNEYITESPEAVVDYRLTRDAQLSDADAVHRMALENLTKADNLTTEVEIENSYVNYEVMKMLQATTVGEDIANMASEIFLPVNTKDRWDFIEEVYGKDANMSYEEFALNFQSLDPTKRVKMLPKIKSLALEATDGNEMRAARFINELYGIDETSGGFDMIMDGAIIVPFLFSAATKAAQGGKFVHSLAKVNKESAADVVVGAAKNDEVSSVTGITAKDAAESVSPLKWSDANLSAIDGIEKEIVQQLDEVIVATANSVKEVAESTIKRSPLTAEEQIAAQTMAISKESDKLRKQYGYTATNGRITKTDEQGFTIEYDIPEGNKSVRVDYNRNDVGVYDDEKIGAVEGGLLSPSVWANRKQKDITELSTAIGFSQEKILHKLMDIANDAYKGLDPKSTMKVDRVLLAGDEYKDASGVVIGREFTPHELMNEGIVGIGRLSKEETMAYYKSRSFWDELHRLALNETAKEWRFNGVKHVGSFADESIYGVVTSAKSLPEGAKKILNLQSKKVEDISLLKSKMDSGELDVVKLQRNVEMGDEIYEYAVIPKDTARRISDLDLDVLPKKTGYVPLIRSNSYYFVEKAAPKIINGESGKQIPQVVRSFSNSKEAEKWAEAEQVRTGIPHTAKYDREVSFDIKSDLQQSQFGKPIFGSRVKDRDILFGFDGTVPERLSAAEAMQRNINAMANLMPMNQFRMAQMEKWHKSARKYLRNPEDPNSGWKVGLSNKHIQSLDEMKKWLDDQFRLPTRSEQKWAGVMRGVAEKMETKFPSAAEIFHKGAHIDPFGKMRGLAFHTLLGWYNPAQLVVQAAGATLAMSLNPVKFPKIIGQYQLVRATTGLSDDAVRTAAKTVGVNPDDFSELMRAYGKSGIVDALKTSADYNAAGLGYSFDAAAVHRAYMGGSRAVDVVRKGVNKAKDSGLIFFREGERFNRTYSWLLAADEYKKLNKIKKFSDADIDNITKQSLKYSMNMNRANRADWQKGWLSIPTQFWQVTAKFYENMMPKMLGGTGNWSTRQKMQVLAGQTFLFGAAGIPLGDSLANWWLDVNDVDRTTVTPEQAAAIKQGMLGVASRALIGEDVDISERLAFGSGFNQLMETFASGNKTFGEIAMGASGAFPSRVAEAMQAIYPRISNPSFEFGEVGAIAGELAKITSTGNNIFKARIMYKLGEIRAKSGETIDNFEVEENMGQIYAQALGFAPSQVGEFYDHKKYQRNITKIRSDALRALENNYRSYLNTDIKDPSNTERWQKMNELIVGSLDPVSQEAVWESWAKKYTTDTSLLKQRNITFEKHFQTGITEDMPITSFQE